ncbi:hypothetical protein [Mediterraneibacter glycyrrhizinilyticus]|uniref:hypothetical protein n=1 Tax=Mediterraneibacter glycyrrhizinilyticus TaxID=342942 RepID=UPI0006D077A9
MKNFNDFWDSISEDEFIEIAGRINEKVEYIRENTENSDNLLGNQIAMVSLSFTQAILSKYHEWLVEQLGLSHQD